MKTSELSGKALDFWVARAEGIVDGVPSGTEAILDIRRDRAVYEPSTNWAQGGPIIERERITVAATGLKYKGWFAEVDGFESDFGVEVGYGRISCEDEEPLVAAMRAYVESKFGKEVPDEVTP